MGSAILETITLSAKDTGKDWSILPFPDPTLVGLYYGVVVAREVLGVSNGSSNDRK